MTCSMLYSIQTILALLVWSVTGQQLLQNAGFEQPLTGDDWFCNSNCDLTQDTDAHTGLYSGRVSNRQENWQTASQWVTLTANSSYYFECWVKPLNITSGQMYQQGQLAVALESQDSTRFVTMSVQPYMTPDGGWQLLSGDFFYGPEEILRARVYAQYREADVDYLVDTTSLTKLIPNENWKTEAEARIEEHRKGDIILSVDLAEDFNLDDISIEVTLEKHDFWFGSAVTEAQLIGTDEDSQKYRDCYFEHFERAVFENAHKWQQMERVRGQVEFPDEAMQVLQTNGRLPMRGHCLFWGNEERIPDWVLPLSAEEMVDEMIRRINYTVPRYQDDVSQWDVNNEQLHGDYFENKTGDIDFLAKIFQEAHEQDEDAVLFLNDYNIVNTGLRTRALANSAQLLLSQGAPVHAIGMQGHMVDNASLDLITQIQKRLEVIGSVGLPVWVTELDVSGVSDPTDKANSYENLMTLFFSDLNVEGIMFWGFSDLHHWRPDAALFEGPDYIPNESGLRWQELMNSRWHTSAKYTPTSHEQTFIIRAFKGQYYIKVSEEDNVLLETRIYLENDSYTLNLIIE